MLNGKFLMLNELTKVFDLRRNCSELSALNYELFNNLITIYKITIYLSPITK